MQHPIEAVLEFWLEEPAAGRERVREKITRWFEGGARIDALIDAQFGGLLERALAGELDAWRRTARGRLALIVLLDQFTRNLFRNTPRAFAGDEAAKELALLILGDGSYQSHTLEERIFVLMPLIHSEDPRHQARASELMRELSDEAPPFLREALEEGYHRGLQFRSIIERFGRFPGRNSVLGRRSTREELQFIASERRR